MRIALPLLTLALALTALRPLAAATPDWQTQMNYQGQLSDPSGVPVADGAYNIAFKVYRDPTSVLLADQVWAGETQSVNLSRGLFTVYLGQVSPLPHLTPAQLAGDCYLSVQVAGEPAEMLPRQKLLPAFFARSAYDLQGLRPDNTANNLLVLDGLAKVPGGMVNGPSLSLPLDVTATGASFSIRVINECGACNAAIFTDLSATGASIGAALRIGGRMAAPDIVNTFIISAGVTTQTVVCTYCKAGDEVFLQAKGNVGSTTRYWINSVNDGNFIINFASGGISTAVSMAYLVVGDF